MQAMILAAGFGTRLRPYSLIKPKPLFPILNRPLLCLLLDMLKEKGFTTIVVNCHHLGEQVEAMLRDYPEVIIQKESAILGTGGSLRCALNHFNQDPVLVINGDIYHSIDVAALYRSHLQSTYPVTMALHDFDRFNTVLVEQDRVKSFKNNLRGQLMAFTGIHVINHEIIEMIPHGTFFHIIDLYQQLAEQEKIKVFDVSGSFWRDIGTPSDYLDLHRELLLQDDSATCFEIGENVHVSDKAQLEEWCVIGRNSIIEEGAVVTRSVVWENSIVSKGDIVCDAIVPGGYDIGE